MTVELLVDYPYNGKDYKVGNLLTADAGTEAGLIAAKLADADTTGATAYVEPPVQVQVVPVTATTNPLTGGVELSAGGVAVATGDPATFVPPTDDYAGIMAAHDAAVANGGGIVKLKNATYNIGSNTIPLTSFVFYEGTGVAWDQNGVVGPLGLPYGGTVITADVTNPVFGYNTEDLNPWSATSCSISGTTLTIDGSVTVNGVSVLPSALAFVRGTEVAGPNLKGGTFILSGTGDTYTVNVSQTVAAQPMYGNSPYVDALALKSSLSIGGGVRKLGIIGGSYGIKCGAYYQGGCNDMSVDEVVVVGCSQWGIWLENHNTPKFGTLVANGCAKGQIYIGGSGGEYQNYGDGVVTKLFFQNNAGLSEWNGRGVVIAARGFGSSFNDMTFNMISGNSRVSNAIRSDTATFDGTTANISVANVENYRVETGITFTTNLGSGAGLITGGPAGLSPGPVYFVTHVSGTAGSGVIQVSKTKGGDPAICNTAGNLTINNRGGQLLEIGGNNATAYTSGMTLLHTDIEQAGTFTTLMQGVKYCSLSIDATGSNIGLVLRSLDGKAGIYNAISNKASGTWDIGENSYRVLVMGLKPSHYVTGSLRTSGIQYNEVDNTYELNISANNYRTIPDITSPNNNWAALQFGLPIKHFHAIHNGLISGGSAVAQVFTLNVSGGNITLPDIVFGKNDDFLGIPFYISNPYDVAGSVLTRYGIQTFNNVAGLVSIPLPANSTVMVIAQKTGSTYYWAQYK